MQRTFLENVLNYFQLATPIIIISPAGAFHLEIRFKSAMTCAELKQLAQDMAGHGTHK
jgi:hypothetical protein